MFRKGVTYENIKCHEKTGFYPLSRRYIFRKTVKVGGQIDSRSPSAILGLQTSES